MFELTPDHLAAAHAEARAAAVALATRFAVRAAHTARARSATLASIGPPKPDDGEADLPQRPPEPRELGPPLKIEPGTIEIAERIRATFRLVR